MVAPPLRGVRVADLTRFVAGSQATMWLTALGADVVKIEPPAGDPYRGQGTERAGGQSVLFMALNAGKRSLAVDFREPSGSEVIDRLLGRCDMFVENARPGSLAAHGLDWETVHSRFPQIVYGSISGYGDVGPEAGRGGFDLILQAETGVMSVTGSPGSGPVKVGAPVLDVGAGLSCALGLLAGYIERLRTGTGSLVSASLLEFGLASLGTLLPGVAMSGREPGLLGTHSPLFAPYGGFRTEDGWLVMAGAGSEHMWQRACAALDLAGLPDDPRFADGAARVAHRNELTSCIEAVLTTQPTGHWLGKLEAAGVPAAEVRGLADVLGWSQVTALGSMQAMPPGQVVGPPFRLDRTVLAYPGPAPALGRDTRPVLAELGYQPDEIARLEDAGVVVTSEPEGGGVAWPEERGTSNEGTRRSEGGMGRRAGPRRRAGDRT
ncbi:MAG TPA: CoA transferase [Streptosporangiaceae bacterium]|nr:CoA transferase [Streptosporangiaceae bacterium]